MSVFVTAPAQFGPPWRKGIVAALAAAGGGSYMVEGPKAHDIGNVPMALLLGSAAADNVQRAQRLGDIAGESAEAIQTVGAKLNAALLEMGKTGAVACRRDSTTCASAVTFVSDLLPNTRLVTIPEERWILKEKTHMLAQIAVIDENEHYVPRDDVYFAFHGSPVSNWLSIVRNGVRNYTGTDMMREKGDTGFEGPGIYLSSSLFEASSYAYPKTLTKAQLSALGFKKENWVLNDEISIIGVFEVPKEDAKLAPSYTHRHMEGDNVIFLANRAKLRMLLVTRNAVTHDRMSATSNGPSTLSQLDPIADVYAQAYTEKVKNKKVFIKGNTEFSHYTGGDENEWKKRFNKESVHTRGFQRSVEDVTPLIGAASSASDELTQLAADLAEDETTARDVVHFFQGLGRV